MSRKKKRPEPEDSIPPGLRVRPHEQLLIDAVAEIPPGRVLCNTAGRAQFARAYLAARPESTAHCWFLDVFQRDQSTEFAEVPSGLSLDCTPDPPEDAVDAVVWCLGFRGENELKREMLQIGYQRLKERGRLLAATDKPEDQWLHTELKKFFSKVTRRPSDQGVLYLATKEDPLPKVKHYESEFAFRDGDRLLRAMTRPSVFSHRHVDPGARVLITSMELEPGMRVLDLGCGAGTVGIAALSRPQGVSVLAVDSNPRAIQCTERGVAMNELRGLTTTLDATGASIPTGEFDLVLANPPYFSNYRIAELFLTTSQRVLKPGGRLQLVTKTPNWFAEHMPAYFAEFDCVPVRDYWLVSGRPRGRRKSLD